MIKNLSTCHSVLCEDSFSYYIIDLLTGSGNDVSNLLSLAGIKMAEPGPSDPSNNPEHDHLLYELETSDTSSVGLVLRYLIHSVYIPNLGVVSIKLKTGDHFDKTVRTPVKPVYCLVQSTNNDD